MYNNIAEYMALKNMEALAKKAESLRVPKIEVGLIQKLDKEIPLHEDKISIHEPV